MTVLNQKNCFNLGNLCHKLDVTITDCELFPGELLTPINEQVDLPNDVFKWLITYYNEAYDDTGIEFISITNLIERVCKMIHQIGIQSFNQQLNNVNKFE